MLISIKLFAAHHIGTAAHQPPRENPDPPPIASAALNYHSLLTILPEANSIWKSRVFAPSKPATRRNSSVADIRQGLHFSAASKCGTTSSGIGSIDRVTSQAQTIPAGISRSWSCPGFVSTNGFAPVMAQSCQRIGGAIGSCFSQGSEEFVLSPRDDAMKQVARSEQAPGIGTLGLGDASQRGTLRPKSPTAGAIVSAPTAMNSLLHLQSTQLKEKKKSRFFRKSNASPAWKESRCWRANPEPSVPVTEGRHPPQAKPMSITGIPTTHSNATINSIKDISPTTSRRGKQIQILPRPKSNDPTPRPERPSDVTPHCSPAEVGPSPNIRTDIDQSDRTSELDSRRMLNFDWCEPSEGWSPSPLPWTQCGKSEAVADEGITPRSSGIAQGDGERGRAGKSLEHASADVSGLSCGTAHGRPRSRNDLAQITQLNSAESFLADLPAAPPDGIRTTTARSDGHVRHSSFTAHQFIGPPQGSQPDGMPPTAKFISSYRQHAPSEHRRNSKHLTQRSQPDLRSQARRDSSRDSRPPSRQSVRPRMGHQSSVRDLREVWAATACNRLRSGSDLANPASTQREASRHARNSSFRPRNDSANDQDDHHFCHPADV